MRGLVPTDPARSLLMGRVRQRGTAAELAVAAALRGAGLAYRRNVRALPGAPDFANRSRRWAVFVNGCYWHRHTGCARATLPKRNREFWLEKFRRNRDRDAAAIRALRRIGFRVVVVWECRTTATRPLTLRLARLLSGRPVGRSGPRGAPGDRSHARLRR